MISAPNSQNPNYKVHVMKGAIGTSVLEEIADIFRNHNIDAMKRKSYYRLFVGLIRVLPSKTKEGDDQSPSKHGATHKVKAIHQHQHKQRLNAGIMSLQVH